MSDDDTEGFDAALLEYQANIAHSGKKLSDAETVDFITRPIYLGPPTPIPGGKRGPKPKRTQYDLAHERRKGLYQRLVRLPGLRIGLGYVKPDEVLAMSAELSKTTPNHKIVQAIVHKRARLNMSRLDESTIRKILRAHVLNK